MISSTIYSSASAAGIRTAVVLLGTALAGCMTIDMPTDPDTYSVGASTVSHLRAAQPLSFRNGYEGEAKQPIRVGAHTWLFDSRQMTETAIVMTERALVKGGVKVVPESGRAITLRVRVTGGGVHGIVPWVQTTARLVLEASFGEATLSIPADNSSPMGAQRAYDGAILFALNRLLVDEKFTAYATGASVSPAPSMAAAAAAISPAVTTPAPAVPSASARFPQVGDTWTYELIQRGQGVSPRPRRYAVKVVYSSEAKISDQVSLDGGAPDEADHTRGRYLVTQVVSVLSPYLGVFEEPPSGPLGEIRISADRGCSGRDRCEVSGRVVGREIVRTRAGQFDAIKVTVNQAWRNPSGYQGGTSDARREFTAWYAPQVKRLVKVSSRTKMGRQPDFDLDLVSYQLK
jgi:hypothetical protein